MNIRVLDTNFTAITVLDTYKSLIWTDRYNLCGDFEIFTPVSDGIFDYIKMDYYLQNRESDHVMIIEKLSISTDPEAGNYLTVTGRSLESILDRRIIWGQKTLSGNLQDGIRTLLEECIIKPSDAERKIENFIFEASTDPLITNLTIDAQYTGDNLYNVICTICEKHNIGFKVTLNDSNKFVFKLYAGVDRSYSQTSNPYVVFSPTFENLTNSNYVESKSALKNVALVGGEGEGSERKYATVGSASGLDRRETFTDAKNVSSKVDKDTTLTNEEYTAKLKERGDEDLAKNAKITSFEGEAQTKTMYKYGVDFFMGDVVQIANEYGHESSSRVIELVTSEDAGGLSVYPTFKTTQKEE